MILSYNIRQLLALLESFYTLTKIRIVVFNDQFKKIAEYPYHDCTFCSIVRTNQAALRKCIASDQYACEKCRETNALYSYTCHAGLTETVAPIRHGNIITGYIMFGQVLQHEDMNAYWPKVQALCAGYPLDMDALKAAFYRKQPVDLKQMYASAQILEACAGYLYLQRYISLQENSLPQQIDAYITEHLGGDLSAEAICRHFSISRSRLYKIANEFYGRGIEQTTRNLRIQKAKELLAETDMPVSEIAATTGYPDYNYFIKVFKKETGHTPARYRKALPVNKGATG